MRILFTEPIVQVFACYMSVLYGEAHRCLEPYFTELSTTVHEGIMYLTLATFSTLWTKDYGENVGISGLHYIALGLGYTLGIQVRVASRFSRNPC